LTQFSRFRRHQGVTHWEGEISEGDMVPGCQVPRCQVSRFQRPVRSFLYNAPTRHIIGTDVTVTRTYIFACITMTALGILFNFLLLNFTRPIHNILFSCVHKLFWQTNTNESAKHR